MPFNIILVIIVFDQFEQPICLLRKIKYVFIFSLQKHYSDGCLKALSKKQ